MVVPAITTVFDHVERAIVGLRLPLILTCDQFQLDWQDRENTTVLAHLVLVTTSMSWESP
jgi:hypothetical protein